MRKPRKKPAANDHDREVHAFKSRYKVHPLEHMLKIINNDKLPMKLRDAMAAAAAPYVHAKLRPIAIDDVGGGLEEDGADLSPNAIDDAGGLAEKESSLDLSKLTDAERERFQQLITKARR